MSESEVKDTIAAAKVVDLPVKSPRAGNGAAGRDAAPRRRRPQRVGAVELLSFVRQMVDAGDIELWHTSDRTAYATLPYQRIARHWEHWPIDSREFGRWIIAEHLRARGSIPGREAVAQATQILEHEAIQYGSMHQVWMRVAEHQARVYVDLCDDRWRCIEIDAVGYRIVERAPVKFRRGTGMKPLPEPRAGSLALLNGLLNVGSFGNMRLVIGWLIGCLNPNGPFPVLQVTGEQGSAKSTFCRGVAGLIDPRSSQLVNLPRELEDVVVQADHCQILGFDNVSKVSNDMSDMLCQIATGSGVLRRAKYTDRDAVEFTAIRPIILNSITDGVGRADLGDRSIVLHIPPIPSGERRTERAVREEFEAIHDKVLGGLCAAVSHALRHRQEQPEENLPRMADFVKFVRAAEPALVADRALGWSMGDFDEAYDANRREAVSATIEADLVAEAIARVIEEQPEGVWEGSPSDLYEACETRITERARKTAAWPGSANAFGKRLQRAAAPLRTFGITVEGPIFIGAKNDRRRAYVVRRMAVPAAPEGEPNGPL